MTTLYAAAYVDALARHSHGQARTTQQPDGTYAVERIDARPAAREAAERCEREAGGR